MDLRKSCQKNKKLQSGLKKLANVAVPYRNNNNSPPLFQLGLIQNL